MLDCPVVGDGRGQFHHRQRVSRGFGEDPRPCRIVKVRQVRVVVDDLVQQRRGRACVQRVELETRQIFQMLGLSSGIGTHRAQHQSGGVRQPASDEGEDIQRRWIEPLCVVDDQHQWLLLRCLLDQPEDGEVDQQTLRRGSVIDAERSQHSAPLPTGQSFCMPQQRIDQFMQTGESDSRLALHARAAQLTEPQRSRASGQLGHQGGFPQTRLALDDQAATGAACDNRVEFGDADLQFTRATQHLPSISFCPADPSNADSTDASDDQPPKTGRLVA